jgi:flagellar hook-associated protein 2
MSTSGINLNGINLLNGQGINVSSLVGQLVTAASVPITQWQAQQTSIQTQISDLNILDSGTTTLANDINALKDPAGAVTSRSVTSSDSSLVSATATAGSTVGSHTVVVNNLATTSSYYTNSIASSSTQLASGSFNISVGSSPANAITIDSTDNTLTGLAAAINNKNIGVTASVITDANGARLALVSQSSGAAGDLNVSNGAILTLTSTPSVTNVTLASGSVASADTQLDPGTFSLTVGSGSANTITIDSSDNTLTGLASAINQQNLGVTASVVTDSNGAHLSLVSQTAGTDLNISNASSSPVQFTKDSSVTNATVASGSVAGANTQLDAGTFSLTVGSGSASTITIDSSDNTLTGLAAAINQQNLGVTASVVTDSNGAHLSLVSQTAGAAGNLSMSSFSDSSPLQFTKAATGVNASLTVDGVPMSSATNTVTGAVTGLSLNLDGADPNTTVNIAVSPDTSSVVDAVTSFVNDYNTLIGEVNQEYTFNTSTNTSGALSGDSTVDMLQSTLLSAMGYSGSGSSAINTLGDLGISMNDDGTLALDSTALTNAATNNYSAIQTFLQGDGSGSNGFANILSTQLDSLTDASSGAFTLDIQGLNSSVSSLQDQISDFQTYLTAEQAMWTTQYDTMNVTLQELPAQQEEIQAELGNQDYANTNNG